MAQVGMSTGALKASVEYHCQLKLIQVMYSLYKSVYVARYTRMDSREQLQSDQHLLPLARPPKCARPRVERAFRQNLSFRLQGDSASPGNEG